MQYIKTKNLTQKKQVLCGLRGIFLLFSCQTPVYIIGGISISQDSILLLILWWLFKKSSGGIMRYPWRRSSSSTVSNCCLSWWKHFPENCRNSFGLCWKNSGWNRPFGFSDRKRVIRPATLGADHGMQIRRSLNYLYNFQLANIRLKISS